MLNKRFIVIIATTVLVSFGIWAFAATGNEEPADNEPKAKETIKGQDKENKEEESEIIEEEEEQEIVTSGRIRTSEVIDTEAPEVIAIEYNPTEPTNGDVEVTIKVNEPIQEVDNWTLSDDEMELTKTYSANVTETITIKDLAGNEITADIKIDNIDKDAPEIVQITQDPSGPTNGKVRTKIKFNEPIKDNSLKAIRDEYMGNGKFIKETETQYYIDYYTYVNFKFEFQDLAGNVGEGKIEVKNIDTIAPKVSLIEYSPTERTNGDVEVIIKANEPIQEIDEWTLSDDEMELTKTYSANETEIITIKDLAGNETTVNIKIDYIDKGAPKFDSISLEPKNVDVDPEIINYEEQVQIFAYDEEEKIDIAAECFNIGYSVDGNDDYESVNHINLGNLGYYRMDFRASDTAGNIAETFIIIKVVVGEETIYNLQQHKLYNNLTDALAEANTDETIMVGEGNYDINNTLTFNTQGVKLISSGGATVTTLKGSDVVVNASNIIIDGFTFTNINAENIFDINQPGKSVVIKNNIIDNTTGSGKGTIIFRPGAHNGSFINNTYSSNKKSSFSVKVHKANNVLIHNNKFEGVEGTLIGRIWFYNNSGNIAITDNELKNINQGILINQCNMDISKQEIEIKNNSIITDENLNVSSQITIIKKPFKINGKQNDNEIKNNLSEANGNVFIHLNWFIVVDNDSASGNYNSLNDAISVAYEGGIIKVASNLTTGLVDIHKPLVIEGIVSNSSKPIIDGNFIISDTTTADKVISNLKFKTLDNNASEDNIELIAGVKNININNCEFENTLNITRAISMPSSIRRENVTIDNCKITGDYLVAIQGYVNNLTIKNSIINGSKSGINLQGGNNLIVLNNNVTAVVKGNDQNSYCLRFAGTTPERDENMDIQNNTFELDKGDSISEPETGIYHSAIIVRKGATGNLKIFKNLITGEVVDLSGNVDLTQVFGYNTFPAGYYLMGNKILGVKLGKIYNKRTGYSSTSINKVIDVDTTKPGDDIYVTGGTYKEPTVINKSINLIGIEIQEQKPILIGKVTINKSGSNARLENLNFIVDQNVTTDVTDNIYIENAENIEILRCHFDAKNQFLNKPNARAIQLNNGNNIRIEDCRFHNGYYVVIQGKANKLTVYKNVITNCKSGINLQRGDDLYIYGNEITVEAQANDSNTYCVRFADNSSESRNLIIHANNFSVKRWKPTKDIYHSAIILRKGASGGIKIYENSIDGELVDISYRVDLDEIIKQNKFPDEYKIFPLDGYGNLISNPNFYY